MIFKPNEQSHSAFSDLEYWKNPMNIVRKKEKSETDTTMLIGLRDQAISFVVR